MIRMPIFPTRAWFPAVYGAASAGLFRLNRPGNRSCSAVRGYPCHACRSPTSCWMRPVTWDGSPSPAAS
jgi:hypothetical protein